MRMKERAKKILRATWGEICKDRDWLNRAANRRADNYSVCSCYMCGNPRRIFKEKTIQELKKQD